MRMLVVTDSNLLKQVVAAASFIPSNRQIRARSAFHQRNPPGTLPELDAALAAQYGAPGAISKWWATPGFSDWWCSPQWEVEESHRLLLQSMQRVSEILRDEENPATVISAAREAREIYTKLNAAQTTKFADDEIGTMSREQLEEYIRRKTAVISK